jgi:hypothetical protein
MRPASRRALLERIAAREAPRGTRFRVIAALVVALVALAALAGALIVGRTERRADPVAPAQPGLPVVDPVLALPFGRGATKAPAAEAGAVNRGEVPGLRAAFRLAGDRRALYSEWRHRSEPDARYLAYRAARDCEALLAGGTLADLDAGSERKVERTRQVTAAVVRCGGFVAEPAAPDEVRQLLLDAAAAGHPAAQAALATERFAQRPLAETVAVLRRSLASGDPLAFDEARPVLALARHRLEIAGVAPVADGSVTDARVVAIDLAGCRLGNPCGPSRGAVAMECGNDPACLHEAQEWLLQAADLGEEERRTALALAGRLFDAFERGALDEIVRLPSNVASPH